MSAREEDARDLVAKWGALTAEVSPLVSPIHLLIRSAAAAEPELVSLLDEISDARLLRMKKNASVLERLGFLRKGLSVETAAEIMWAYTAPELYDLLERRGHVVEVGPAWSEGRLTAASRVGRRRRAAANPRGMQGYAAGR